MADIDIAFDNDDPKLGKYFEASKVDLVNFLNSRTTNSNIIEIDSRKCNQAFIDIHLPRVNSNRFLFIAYSHGFDNRLTVNGNYYIHSNVNPHLFVNSFFYSMSCHTAKILGHILNSNGCLAFIGYDNFAYAFTGKFQQVSIDCDNFAIKKFIGSSTIQEAFDLMKEYMTLKIDEFETGGEVLTASQLRNNRDALILIGNGNLKKSDFNII